MDSEFVEGCANIWMSCVLLSFNLFVAPVIHCQAVDVFVGTRI